jgi:hypothetical protein
LEIGELLEYLLHNGLLENLDVFIFVFGHIDFHGVCDPSG